MTPEILQNYKNLFLIFPFGCGGNHLANMLSMAPEFTNRFVSDSYVQRMYEMYDQGEKVAFHHSDLQNLQPRELALYGERYINSELKNIWCAHHCEFTFANRGRHKHPDNYPYFSKIDKRIFCLFSSPTVGSLAFDRIYFGPWDKRSKENPLEVENPKYYQLENFCKPIIPNFDESIDPATVFTLDTEKFFVSYDYLSTTIYENLQIELPEICRLFHHLWLERQKQEIEKNKVDFNSEYHYNIVDTVNLNHKRN